MTTTTELDILAPHLARDVFRTDFGKPGYVLLDLGTDLTPRDFRARIITLARTLADGYYRRHGELLRFHSASCFDQQAPTRPHRDGGPDASFLLLGYEPSEVRSRVSLMDYSRAALDRGMTPQGLLDCCNPAFGGNADLLRPYTIEVTDFQPRRYQILIINNSQLPYEQRHQGTLGLLHHAVIEEPNPDRSRVINSVLMGVIDSGLSEEQLRDFIEEGKAATR